MRVAFDAICLADGPATGVARAFLTGLSQYVASWPDDAIVLAPEDADRHELPDVTIVDAPRGAVRRQRRLPAMLRELDADVLHSAVASVPLRARCPTIATIHDLPWLHPESGERTSWRRRLVTRWSLRAADAILAPSRYTLDAAADWLGCRDRLHLAPHATPPAPESAASGERDGPFLVLGDDRPRKNRDRVRAAHAIARRHDPDLPPLRFVGPPDAYVDEAEKARLLGRCRAVVACSLYEGFGLPVLEALVHGAPLLCSDLPPHREIAGDRARYVDPRDVGAIAEAMLEPAWPGAPAPIAPPRVAEIWRALHRQLTQPR